MIENALSEGNLYLLNEKQWRAFTGKIMTEFKARIDAADSVEFDRMLDMDEVLPGA